MPLDGITLNDGSGSVTLATDRVSTFDFQIVKIGHGADDSTPTSVSDSAPLPVAAKHDLSAIMNGTTVLTPKRAVIFANTSGDTEVVAAVASKQIVVMQLAINAFGDVNVEFQDDATATTRSGLFDMGTSAGKAKGLVLAFSPVGHFATASGVGLDINLSDNIVVEGHLTYVEV